jgi:sulfur carrier protein ThiS
MPLTLKLYGNLKRFAPTKKEIATLDIAPGIAIRDLLAQLGVPDENVWMCAVNDSVVNDATVLRANDVLEVFEPVGGG